jgi:photosystem II stability/assembly factor-like uncharacterized protein
VDAPKSLRGARRMPGGARLVTGVGCCAFLGAALLTCAGIQCAWATASADESAPIGILVSGTAHEALFAIAFNGRDGMAVGSAGAVLASSDAGLSWKQEARVPTSLALLGVDLNATSAVAVGQSGLILTKRLANGVWNRARSGTSNRLFSVGLNARGEALAVGAFGTVLKSTDAGETWQSAAPSWKAYADDGVEPHMYVAQVANDGTLTICGEFGLILHSTNGGVSWDLAHKGDASIFALHIRADGTGYAVGQSGTILQSVDRGATWKALVPATKANLLGVHSTASGHVVVTGMRDMLESEDEGRSWRHISTPETTTSWYGGIGQAGSSTPILIVGHAGQIARVDR